MAQRQVKENQPRRGNYRNQRGRRVLPQRWNSADPPSFNPNPWNKMTLEFNFQGLTPTNHGTLTVGNTIATIRSQASINVLENTWWLVKFHAMAAWEIEGNALEVTINDLDNLRNDSGTNEDYTALRTLSDTPGRNKWAHVAMTWPRDLRNNVYTDNQDGPKQILFIKSNNSEGTSVVRLYLRIMWRTTAQNTPGRTLSGPIGNQFARQGDMSSRDKSHETPTEHSTVAVEPSSAGRLCKSNPTERKWGDECSTASEDDLDQLPIYLSNVTITQFNEY